YTYAASNSNDGFWGGSWCSMTTSPSQPWTSTTSRTMTVATTPIDDQSLWISCPSNGNADFPVHPGPGQFMSGLPQGTPLLQDDAEGTAVAWELSGLWHRVASTPCVTPSAAAGVGAFWYGDPNGCNYDHRPTFSGTGSIGIGWMTSPALAGLQQGSTIEFDSYRDIGGRDETNVIIFPQGQGSHVNDDTFQTKVWARSGPVASDRGWEHVTITLPWAWYYGQPVQVRFAVETYEAFDHRDQKGWLVDNVKISR
ncbi:MAG: hypothetical protein JWO86_4663, partial [Myxococcaceae bacterium]|nr:hypothetical protein [Myxococcaceae bacterium]